MTTTATGTRGRPAIFLDKDGTLIEDVPYNVDPDAIRLAPHAEAALRRFARLDAPLIIITNQPGVALGFFERDDLRAVEDRLAALFARCGATLAGFHACPHHPRGSVPAYTSSCLCRKPMPGLLQQAAVEHGIDLQGSWFVGDILDDIEAGRRAGCHTILIDNGNETEWSRDPDNLQLRTPNHIVPDLDIAARIIGSTFGRPGPSDSTGPHVGASRRAVMRAFEARRP